MLESWCRKDLNVSLFRFPGEGKQTTSCENNEKDCCQESSKKCMLDSDDSYEDYEDLLEDAKG